MFGLRKQNWYWGIGFRLSVDQLEQSIVRGCPVSGFHDVLVASSGQVEYYH
jgi:hypothetical protein